MVTINTWLQVIFMVVTLIIMSIVFVYSKKGKLLSLNYIAIIFFSLMSGYAFYVGILWILKIFDIIIDKSIFDSVVYSAILGCVLIVFTAISLKQLLEIKQP